MRNLHLLDVYRKTGEDIRRYYGGVGDATCGAFVIPSKVDHAPMSIIASAELGWDHVSVSRKNRTPNWAEMSQVRDLFFKDDETVMQLHVPKTDHINEHPHTLHLWKPQNQEIPRPPSMMVGGLTKDEIDSEVARLVQSK